MRAVALQEQPLPEGVQMGVPHTFHTIATAPPSGYPAFPQNGHGRPAQGFLTTPTAPAATPPAGADMPPDIPMYTATIK